MLLFSTSFVVGATRYFDPIFEVSKTSNLVYAKDAPFLAKKHAITALVSGLKMESEIAPTLYFYQNSNETIPHDLEFDFYQPKNDTLNNRPLIIVVHGGAFVSGNKGDSNEPITAYCDSLASRGYNVAALNYRIGLAIKNSQRNKLIIDSLEIKRAIQWGVQDIQNAIQYFKANADRHRIDSEKIFVIGNSSGAILALQSVCERNNLSPQAIVSLWGAVIDKEQIKNISIPVLLIHGTADRIIPFQKGNMLNLDSVKAKNSGAFGYKTFATAFHLEFNSPIFYGSTIIDSALIEQNTAHDTYFVNGEDHEFYKNDFYRNKVLRKIIEFLFPLVDATSK